MPAVQIAGVGVAEPSSDEQPSHAELLYRSTRAALDDAGIGRGEITTAITSSYDYTEGRALSNQFTLDSIGGTMKPCDLRLGDDGVHALAAGVSLALADPGSVVVVAAVQLRRGEHSAEAYRRIEELSYEPVFGRPVVAGAASPQAIAFGLRAQQYMAKHGTSEDDLANLVSRRSNGGAVRRSADEILESTVVAGPIRAGHIAPATDVAATIVVSTDPPQGRTRGAIRGVGWAALDATLSSRRLDADEATGRAARDAYARAGIQDPAAEVGRAEVYNVYGIDEIQAVEALGLAPPGGAIEALKPSAGLRTNPTGGTQSHGWAPGAASLAATARSLLDGEAAEGVLVTQGWTGCGGCSSAVAVIEPAE